MNMMLNMLRFILEPIMIRLYPAVMGKLANNMIKLQSELIWKTINEINKKEYKVVLMMNPQMGMSVMQVAAAELDTEEKLEAKKKQFEIIRNE